MQHASTTPGWRLTLLLTLGLSATRALAAGFSIPEISVAGIGLSNALVANPIELGAIAYNPAAMGLHSRSSLALDLLFFNPNLEVNTATGTHDSEHQNNVFIPALQGAYKLAEVWTLGLGVNTPFGLETAWTVGTFPGLSTALVPGTPAGPFHPTQSKLELFSVVPALAYQISSNLSIAAGMDYYHARKVNFDTAGAQIRGDGNGYGWNISALWADGPWSFGGSYHTAATVDGRGDFIVTNPLLLQLGRSSQPLQADLHLPWRFQIGAGYAINERLRAELDFERTGWSEFDTLEFYSQVNGSLISRSTNRWNDSNAYRLGLTYTLTPQTRLRFGYAFNESAQTTAYFSPRIPDNDRQTFSLGVAQDLGNGWELAAGYMYVLFKDTDYSGGRSFTGADINGTTAINGNYKADVHIFGLGASLQF